MWSQLWRAEGTHGRLQRDTYIYIYTYIHKLVHYMYILIHMHIHIEFHEVLGFWDFYGILGFKVKMNHFEQPARTRVVR